MAYFLDHTGYGLKYVLWKCREQILCSDPSDDRMGENSSAVLRTISTGCGYSQMAEHHAALNISAMFYRQYAKHHNKLYNVVYNVAPSTLKEAEEEHNFAVKNGEVANNGVPYITVVPDGAWSKRLYRINYDASTDATCHSCIIGAQTGKLLFLGVRNKYCTLCARYEEKRETCKPHICFKNWKGSSTGMEANIIVGFRTSMEMEIAVSKETTFGKTLWRRSSKKNRMQSNAKTTFCATIVEN